MFASRMLSLPIVKERLFSTVRKEAVLHYTCPRFPSRTLHEWLTANASWYADNPNLGLPNGEVEIYDNEKNNQ